MYGAAHQIELDAAMLEYRLLDGRLAAQQGSQPRQQLLQAERLGEVIIRSQIQSFDSILNGVARTQYQNWFVETGLAPLLQKLETVAIRQAEVENYRVVIRFAQGIARIVASAHPGDAIGSLAQGCLKKQPYAALICDSKTFPRRALLLIRARQPAGPILPRFGNSGRRPHIGGWSR